MGIKEEIKVRDFLKSIREEEAISYVRHCITMLNSTNIGELEENSPYLYSLSNCMSIPDMIKEFEKREKELE